LDRALAQSDDVDLGARDGIGLRPPNPSRTARPRCTCGAQPGPPNDLKEKLTGFGLVLSKDDSGFSWEWFDRDGGDVFRKLLGGGKVRVTVVETAESQELVAVEFLDDIVLSCEDQDTGTTHEVRREKGGRVEIQTIDGAGGRTAARNAAGR